MIRGCFSFDSTYWLEPRSYCFHPPETVHAFKSAVREESWFLSRVGCFLDVNLVPEPVRLSPYYVSSLSFRLAPSRCTRSRNVRSVGTTSCSARPRWRLGSAS